MSAVRREYLLLDSAAIWVKVSPTEVKPKPAGETLRPQQLSVKPEETL
jgi:hypothetical protein